MLIRGCAPTFSLSHGLPGKVHPRGSWSGGSGYSLVQRDWCCAVLTVTQWSSYYPLGPVGCILGVCSPGALLCTSVYDLPHVPRGLVHELQEAGAGGQQTVSRVCVTGTEPHCCGELSWKAKLWIYPYVYVPTHTSSHGLWAMTKGPCH